MDVDYWEVNLLLNALVLLQGLGDMHNLKIDEIKIKNLIDKLNNIKI